jgi:muramoyltetrapeptide carboxypeptidase
LTLTLHSYDAENMLTTERTSFVRPPALLPGDQIGIVAPASNIKSEMLDAGCRELERLGFRTLYRPDIVKTYRYFSGTDERRAAELLEMVRNPEVKAIFCARGGYGSGRLIPHLEPELFLAHPKIILGSSDITMLLAFLNRHGLVGFHGAMVAQSMRLGEEAYDRSVLVRMLKGDPHIQFPVEHTSVLRSGEAEGRLAGGCLTMVVATLGTSYEIDTDDTILVLEDLGEKPYKIDRMLTQLKQAGKLEKVRGIVFGEMLDCTNLPNQGYTLEEVILDVLEGTTFPILYGFSTGHTSRPNIVVPFGIHAKLSLGSVSRFELLESAVSQA